MLQGNIDQPGRGTLTGQIWSVIEAVALGGELETDALILMMPPTLLQCGPQESTLIAHRFLFWVAGIDDYFITMALDAYCILAELLNSSCQVIPTHWDSDLKSLSGL